jgi:AcrR family transcriptional regulator
MTARRATARATVRVANRTEVLERAATAISHHGYHGMSMRDLARATGRGLASFYTLCQSKEDILFEIQERAFETLLASAERAVATEKEPAARLHAAISNHVRYVVDQTDVMRVLVQEAYALPPKRRAIIRALKERYFELGRGLVDAVLKNGCGVGSGTDSAPDPLDVERATYCLFGMLNWIYGWYDKSRHGSPDVLAQTIFHTTLCGITASCPHRSAADATHLQTALPRRPILTLLDPQGRKK